MRETKLELSPTCCFEMVEFDTFPATLTLEYVEHATDHWNSDTETSIDISVDQTKEIIALLQKYVDAAQPTDKDSLTVAAQTADRAAGGECCEWTVRQYIDRVKWFGTSCGRLERQTTGPFCQRCSRKIHVKES